MFNRKKKLSTLIRFPILLAVFIILTLSFVIDLKGKQEDMHQDLEDEAYLLLDMSSAAMAQALWTYNEESIDKIATVFLETQTVAKVQIMDDYDNIIYETEKSEEPYDVKYHDMTYKKDIFYDNIYVGQIHLTTTAFFLRDVLYKELGSYIVKMIFINIAIFIAIMFVSSKITSAIDRIAEGITAFSEGDESYRIEVQGNHDLERLSNRLNSMFDTIINTRQTLLTNIRLLKNKEENLRIAQDRYKHAVEGSNDVIWDWNIIEDIFYISNRGLQIVGLEEDAKINQEIWLEYVHNEDKAQYMYFIESFRDMENNYKELQYRVVAGDGEIKWLFARGKSILDQSGRAIRVSGFITEITERTKAEESFDKLTYYDMLTGLPNRVMLFQRLSKIFSDGRRLESALVHIDLDDFKTINDTKGHKIGDEIIQSLASKLNEEIHCDVIARVGGDEFAIIVSGCDLMQAGEIAEQAQSIINTPIKIKENVFNLTASIGIAIYPYDGQDLDTLFMNADNATYKAKELGKNRYEFYEKSMNEKMVLKHKMEDDIRRGLAEGEFILHYQPQLDYKSKKIIAVEALVRWDHYKKGLLSPMTFIGFAEDNGLITPLGEHILKVACTQSVYWESIGVNGIIMAVNISSKQFSNRNLVQNVQRIINETGMDPKRLKLEITESVAMESLETTMSIMTQLKEIGVSFSLDDFGTGYSSLSYLKALPIDQLKIDRHFIKNVTLKNYEQVMVGAIIDIAHSMGLKVVAEGIETSQQSKLLESMSCDIAQGYLFGKPMGAEAFVNLVYQSVEN